MSVIQSPPDVVTWRVTSELTEPLNVSPVNKADGYPHLGLKFSFDESGRLTGWNHEFTVEPSVHQQQVVASSESALRHVVDALSWFHGERLSVRPVAAVHLHPPPGHALHAGTGHYQLVGVSAHLVVPPRMPDERKLAAADPRLRFWLNTAILARETESDEEAVRLYAIIREDIHGKITGPATTAGHELKYTRDFVSHAELHNDNLLDFVESRLGTRTNRFDRNDRAHQRFLRDQRVAAANLIHGELRDRLL